MNHSFNEKSLTELPFAGSIECGFPSPATEYLESQLNLHELLVKKPAATFFMRAQGDSMTGVGIYEGDLLVIDRSISPRPGHIVAVSLEGEYTLKILRVIQGVPSLVSANPKYPPLAIRNFDELNIFGVLTYNIHKHSL